MCVGRQREDDVIYEPSHQISAHHHLARREFEADGVITNKQFDLVDWQMVQKYPIHGSKDVPSMGMQAGIEHHPNQPQALALDDSKPTLP